MKSLIAIIGSIILSGCSVFGVSNVETAPYKVLEKSEDFELRHYDSLILVSTSMSSMGEDNKPFRKLFNYISGRNANEQEISMTAPVFMNREGDNTTKMSFVMPADFSIADTPTPQDPDITIDEINDYTVATIQFSGLLNQDNITKHEAMLRNWIAEKNYNVIGDAKAAGYNPPFTIPALRRNEILIPVAKK